jgi:hypothetical protein
MERQNSNIAVEKASKQHAADILSRPKIARSKQEKVAQKGTWNKISPDRLYRWSRRE